MENFSKTIGILAYITPIGFIAALVMNQNKTGEEKSFGAFHLRQALGLFAISFILSVILAILIFISDSFTYLNDIIFIAELIFAILGIVNASKGEKKVLPGFGDYIQNKYSNTFE